MRFFLSFFLDDKENPRSWGQIHWIHFNCSPQCQGEPFNFSWTQKPSLQLCSNDFLLQTGGTGWFSEDLDASMALLTHPWIRGTSRAQWNPHQLWCLIELLPSRTFCLQLCFSQEWFPAVNTDTPDRNFYGSGVCDLLEFRGGTGWNHSPADKHSHLWCLWQIPLAFKSSLFFLQCCFWVQAFSLCFQPCRGINPEAEVESWAPAQTAEQGLKAQTWQLHNPE